MRALRFLWRLGEAAGTLVWIISVVGGIAIAIAAGIYGAFAAIPRFWQVIAVIAVFAAASIAIMEVIQYGRSQVGRFRRPRLRVSTGTGPEFLHTTPPTEADAGPFDGLIRWQFPDDRVTLLHSILFKVAEEAGVRAENVVVRISTIDPPPKPGQYSLPVRLHFIGAADAQRVDLEPGEHRYVHFLAVCQTAEGRLGLTPPFYLEHDDFVFEIEVLVDGKRADVRYFKMTGLSLSDEKGERVVAPGAPEIAEIAASDSRELARFD